MSEKEILRQELEDGVPTLQRATKNAIPKQDTLSAKAWDLVTTSPTSDQFLPF